MKPFTTLTSKMVAIPTENIDTDQIIPAQFLKTISKAGLGKNLFYHWRYREDGSPNPDFPLNQPEAQGAYILLAGDNFGCGSSREHAPWSLMDYGFRAIISTSFADIFRNNSLKNGLLPVIVDEATYQQLLSLVEEDPETAVTIDLAAQTVTLPDGRALTFPIDPFSKTCMLDGLDQLGYLLKQEVRIAEYENAHPARVNTSGD
ncbi:MAG TPA: 3-isopropylmalate dehydratase small subunit [Chromatiaceae bacterium]|nr:3-isopropylmalate dehydratase small subunit [Chromatiaceae bacterium]HIP69893.1 3-isopropylmalate dehydratase small subunit [Anaerolineae bacterium]